MSDEAKPIKTLLVGGGIDIIGSDQGESLGVSLLLTTLPTSGDILRFEVKMSAADAIEFGTRLAETGQVRWPRFVGQPDG